LNYKIIFTVELRKILTYKEELLTDVKNMLYRCTDDIERLQKVITDTEQQFVDCLRQIKMLGEEKEQQQKELEQHQEELEQHQKELEDLNGAAQQLVDMVDPLEGGEADGRSLLERLLGAPQKVLNFITEVKRPLIRGDLNVI
jgi:septal ring factor EnvC (AmiA/AmiB activator)